MSKNHLEKFGFLMAENDISLLTYWDKDMTCRYANKAHEKWFGIPVEEIIDHHSLEDLIGTQYFEISQPYIHEVFKGKMQVFEAVFTLVDHKEINVKVILTPEIVKDKVNGFFCQVTDITGVKRLEDATINMQRSQRIFEFTSSINDLILHSSTKEEICAAICQIAVESGNFIFAWLGVEDPVTLLIEPIQWAGKEEGYLEYFKSTLLKKELSDGSERKAFREGKYYYSNDIQTDPVMATWKDEAIKRNYRSCIALPLKVGTEVVNVFKLYADRVNFFTVDEIALLNRVSENISYALTAFDNIQKRNAAEAQLQKISHAVEFSSASVVITNVMGDIEYVNPAFSKLTGYSFDEVKGQNPRILKTDHTSPEEYKKIWQTLNDKKVWQGEFFNRKKNGDTFWEKASIAPVLNAHNNISSFIAVKEDITEIKNAEKELLRLTNELREFSGHLQNIAEIEKEKIMKEIHDELGQGLISLKMEVYHLKKHLSGNEDKIEQQIENLLTSVNNRVDAFRKIYHSVNPTMLKDLGLYSTVENFIAAFGKSTQIEIEFHSNIENEKIDGAISLAIYRIIQEALSNVKDHAAASHCMVSLTSDQQGLVLNIDDDGNGFDLDKVNSTLHFGILGMRERTYSVDGEFSMHSDIGEGTHICVTIPLRSGHKSASTDLLDHSHL